MENSIKKYTFHFNNGTQWNYVGFNFNLLMTTMPKERQEMIVKIDINELENTEKEGKLKQLAEQLSEPSRVFNPELEVMSISDAVKLAKWWAQNK